METKQEEHLTLQGLKQENMNSESTLGFVKIAKLGKAQQAAFSTEYLASMLKLLQAMSEMDIQEVIITLETDCPIVIGTRDMGIAIAPRIHKER